MGRWDSSDERSMDRSLGSESRPLTLWIHTVDFDSQELLLSPQLFDEFRLHPGDLVEMRRLEAVSKGGRASETIPISSSISSSSSATLPAETHVVLRVAMPSKGTSVGAMQVSVLKAVAEVFELSNRQSVSLRPLSRHAACLDWIEITFKDQVREP